MAKNGQAEGKRDTRRNCRVREEVNTFTIRLGIFVSDNLLAKLGKLAATGVSLHGQTYISSVARSSFPFSSFDFNFRVLRGDARCGRITLQIP